MAESDGSFTKVGSRVDNERGSSTSPQTKSLERTGAGESPDNIGPPGNHNSTMSIPRHNDHEVGAVSRSDSATSNSQISNESKEIPDVILEGSQDDKRTIPLHPEVRNKNGTSTPLRDVDHVESALPIVHSSVLGRAVGSGINTDSSIWEEDELEQSDGEIRPKISPLPRSRETRSILLQTSDAEWSRRLDHDKDATLSSGTTLQSYEGPRTPLRDGEYTLSPLTTASPIDFPVLQDSVPTSSWLWRTQSQRQFSRSEKGSIRRTGRRSTSAKSSASPASAFLSQWRSSSQVENEHPLTIKADSEGQEIADSGYIIGKQVGRGAFSTIKEVHGFEKGVKTTYAVKIVKKAIDGADDTENEKLQGEFDREVEIWRYLKHPSILPLIVVYDSSFATFCITHLIVGGTLLDVLASNQKQKRSAIRKVSSQSTNWASSSMSDSWGTTSQILSPTDRPAEPIPEGPPGIPLHLARRYLFQLASALRYLHEDVRVIHRDVKPDNCLIDMSNESADAIGGNLLLCDFGLAEFISVEDRATPDLLGRNPSSTIHASTSTITGSVNYISPESVECEIPVFSPAVDIWAFGVVAYAVLVGALPFSHDHKPILMQRIKNAEFNVERLNNAVKTYSLDGSGVAEMVMGCLEVDTNKRFTIAQVLQCAWFQGAEQLYIVDRDWTKA